MNEPDPTRVGFGKNVSQNSLRLGIIVMYTNSDIVAHYSLTRFLKSNGGFLSIRLQR